MARGRRCVRRCTSSLRSRSASRFSISCRTAPWRSSWRSCSLSAVRSPSRGDDQRKEHEEEEIVEKEVASHRRVMVTAFLVIFLAEWGDLTQILTANLAAHYHDPLSVAPVLCSLCGRWLALRSSAVKASCACEYRDPAHRHGRRAFRLGRVGCLGGEARWRGGELSSGAEPRCGRAERGGSRSSAELVSKKAQVSRISWSRPVASSPASTERLSVTSRISLKARKRFWSKISHPSAFSR